MGTLVRLRRACQQLLQTGAKLDRVFPNAETLIQKMQLDVRYKDVTFETLNQPDFLESVKAAFPRVDWDKTYAEFRAAGEAQKKA